MFNKYRPISISLSPNVQKDDVFLALKLLFQFWKWKRGSATEVLENEFKKYLGVKYAVSFNSGRSSLFAILKALNLAPKSNIALQAFTCNAVANPILWADLNPVYVDCSDDFNLDLEKLKEKLALSKVVIVQHTFGAPARVKEIIAMAQASGTLVIEDCAHALGAQVDGALVGTFGDAAFFSFSRDKVISCVYGGMAVTNNDALGKKLQALQKEFGMPSFIWIKQQLLHPVFLQFIVLPLYHFFDLGKIFLVVMQWLHILSKAVSWREKKGMRPDYFPRALPNALALLALNQFKKLETFNANRQRIAQIYAKALAGSQFGLPKQDGIFLRFAVTHPRAHEILYEAWHKENMLLGDWYTSVIAPFDTKLEEVKYVMGMCPNAELLAQKTLNLPTHITLTEKEINRVVAFLKKYQ
jgi:dTDP-4-amino-4,6-dideoxygalactose transaminase